MANTRFCHPPFPHSHSATGEEKRLVLSAYCAEGQFCFTLGADVITSVLLHWPYSFPSSIKITERRSGSSWIGDQR
jgi:hypothetical protein